MKEVLIRSLTGAAYIALTVGAAWTGPFTSLLLFLPVAAVAAGETHRLLHRGNASTSPAWDVLACSTFYLAIALGPLLSGWQPVFALAVALLLFLAGCVLILFRDTTDPMRDLGGNLLMLLFVALPFGLIPHFVAQGPGLFITFMILLWTNDTGAYVVGRLLGKQLLLPRVSPKKTVEGLVGGLAATLIATWPVAPLLPDLTLWDRMIMGFLVVVTATLGDLLESAFKRAAGVKDSGHILPGHGGILDRFDGFLLAAPTAWLFLQASR